MMLTCLYDDARCVETTADRRRYTRWTASAVSWVLTGHTYTHSLTWSAIERRRRLGHLVATNACDGGRQANSVHSVAFYDWPHGATPLPCLCLCVVLFVCLSLARCSCECVSSACVVCAVSTDRYLLLLRGGRANTTGLPARPIQPDTEPCFVSCRRAHVSTPPRSSSASEVASHAAYKARLQRSSELARTSCPPFRPERWTCIDYQWMIHW